MNVIKINFPLYESTDKYWAVKDGDTHIEDFCSFISQLLDYDAFDNPVERGIAKYVDINGTSTLSERRSWVLSTIVSRYNKYECLVCGTSIPLNEALDCDSRYNLCSYHRNNFEKN